MYACLDATMNKSSTWPQSMHLWLRFSIHPIGFAWNRVRSDNIWDGFYAGWQTCNNLRQTYKYRRIVWSPGEQQPAMVSQGTSKRTRNDSHGNLQFGIERVLDAVDEDFMLISYWTRLKREYPPKPSDIFGSSRFVPFAGKALSKFQNPIRGHKLDKKRNPGDNWHRRNFRDNYIWWQCRKVFNENVSSLVSWRRVFSPFGDVNKPGDGSTEQVSAAEAQVSGGKNASLSELTSLPVRQKNCSRQLKRLEKGLPRMWRHTTQIGKPELDCRARG